MLRAGQGHDWPDQKVLRQNGLSVLASPIHEGLFNLLERGRIDNSPRSVAEVDAELARRAEQPIVLESHLLLHYPRAQFFYVCAQNPALADAPSRGMQRRLAAGSLRRLFALTCGSLKRGLNLRDRQLIELDDANTFVPSSATPGMWFAPDERH